MIHSRRFLDNKNHSRFKHNNSIIHVPKHVVKLTLNKLMVVATESTVICSLLRYYAGQSGNSVPTIRNNLSVSSSTVKKSKKNWISWPETSVRYYHSALRNIPGDWRSHLRRGGSLRPWFLSVNTAVTFLFNKTNRRINFPNLFCQETTFFGQFLCPSSGVFHR